MVDVLMLSLQESEQRLEMWEMRVQAATHAQIAMPTATATRSVSATQGLDRRARNAVRKSTNFMITHMHVISHLHS